MEYKKRLKIYLVDDEPGVAAALKDTLEQIENSVIETFENAQGCLNRTSHTSPDLVITDVNLGPGPDGIELLRELKVIHPKMPVLLITGYGDIPMAVRALKAGAGDFIEKPLDEDFFLSVVTDLLEEAQSAHPFEYKPLTAAEMKILHQITQGKTNKEIATEFTRSIRTIENHRRRILKKLNAKTTAQLIKNAFDLGLTMPG